MDDYFFQAQPVETFLVPKEEVSSIPLSSKIFRIAGFNKYSSPTAVTPIIPVTVSAVEV